MGRRKHSEFYFNQSHLKIPELTVGEIVGWGSGEVDGDVGAADHLLLLLLQQHLGQQLVTGGHAGEIRHLDIDNHINVFVLLSIVNL